MMTRQPITRVLRRANSLAKRRHKVTIYVPVANNVYYDGMSYRVRVTRDYVRTSANFDRISDAIKFRNQIRNI